MKNSQKVKERIQILTEKFLKNREREYNARNHKVLEKMEAISKIRRQMAYVKDLDFNAHCSMVRTLNPEFTRLIPDHFESPKNKAIWQNIMDMRTFCAGRKAPVKQVSEQIKMPLA